MSLLAPEVESRVHGSPAVHVVPATTRWLCLLALGAAALLPVVTLRFHLGEFGDGAFFTVVAMSDHPWQVFWHNFPARTTAFLVNGALPHAVMTRTGSTTLAVAASQTIWAAAPLVSLVASARVLPSERRSLMVYPAAWFLGAGLTLYGFPSEVWLTQALAWPLLFALLFWRGTTQQVVMVWVMSFAFAFTHEMMLTTAAVLLVAALSTARRDGRRTDWRVWPVLTAAISAVAVAAFVKPSDPEIAAAVSFQASLVMRPEKLLPGLAALLVLVLALAVAIHLACAGPLARHRPAAHAARGGFVVAVAAVAGWLVLVRPEDRYLSRTAVAVGLALATCLAMRDGLRSVEDSSAAGRAAQVQRLVAWCALPMFAVQVGVGTRFVHDFVDYRQQLRALVNDSSVALPSQAYVGVPPADAATSRAPFRDSMAWDWALPFASVLAGGADADRLLVLRGSSYVPIPCRSMDEFAHLPARSKALLAAYVCSRRPSGPETGVASILPLPG